MTNKTRTNGKQENGTEEHDNFYHYQDQNYECKNLNCNVTKFRNPDGTLRLLNPNIENLSNDVLYHLAISTDSHNLISMFGNVKFVCMGGTADRMKTFANFLLEEIDFKLPVGTTLQDLTQKSLRFSMYKVGPVLCVNHGMGVPSIGILLNEIIKLLYYAKAKDPIFLRIGTSGGIGLQPCHVVISDKVVDELCNSYYELKICGKLVKRPALLDQRLVKELVSLSRPNDPFNVVSGTTMCANDFYEGQGRIDGAICEHTENDKLTFLKNIHKQGVRNIEMEAVVFAAMTYHLGIKSALVNATLVDRLNGDQVTTPKEILREWQNYPQIIVARYIKKMLSKS